MIRAIALVALVAAFANAQGIPPRERCMVCHDLANVALKATSLEQFKMMAPHLCMSLHQGERADCHDLFMKHGDDMYNAEHQGHHTADQVCAHLHECEHVPMTTTMAPPAIFAPDMCGVCEHTGDFILKDANRTNNNKTQIKADTIAFCEHQSDTQVRAACLDGLRKYGIDLYVDEVMKHMTSAAACKALGECSAKKEESSQLFDGCTVCQLIVTTLGKFADKDEPNIKMELESACAHTAGFSGLCVTLVDEYLPEIVEYLEDKTDAKTLCQKMKMCHARAVEEAPEKESGILCTGCKLLIGYAEREIGQNSTEEEVKKVLDRLCLEIPVVGNACEHLVDDNIDRVVHGLINKYPASVICGDIGACKSQDAVIAVSADHADPAVAVSFQCVICKDVEHELADLIGADEETIRSRLDGICHDLPFGKVIDDACVGVINSKLPELVKYLQSPNASDKVCEGIHLCSA